MPTGTPMNYVAGSDYTRPLPAVTYSTPKPKQTGLDWSKHTAPTPTPTELEAVTRRRATTAKPRRAPNPDNRCACGNRIASTSTRCRSCASRANAARPRPTSRKPRGPRPAPFDLPAAAADYTAGATIPALADAYNVTPSTMRRHLRRSGITLRDDRQNRSGGQNRITDPTELVERVRDLYTAGHSQPQVAAELGLSTKQIHRVMTRHGIPARHGQSGRGDTMTGYRTRLAELGVTTTQIRDWANAHGVPVSVRGTVAAQVIDAYEEARS
jgi:hypothetical protein